MNTKLVEVDEPQNFLSKNHINQNDSLPSNIYISYLKWKIFKYGYKRNYN